VALRVPRRLLARASSLILFCALALAPTTDAVAADNGRGVVALSPHTRPSPRADRTVREALAHLGMEAADIEVRHGLDDLLGEDEVGLFGIDEVSTCEGEPLGVDEFERALSDADEHMAFAEYQVAEEVLGALRQQLPCLDEAVGATRLHRLHLLEGVATWHLGDEEAARAAFERAVVVDEAYGWGGEFGPRPQELHVQAMRRVLSEPQASLMVAWMDPQTQAILDGQPLELTEGWAKVQTRAGEHLLQVFPSTGDPWQCTLDLTGEVVLLDRRAFLTGLAALESGDTAEYGGPALPALAAISSWMLGEGFNTGWLVVVPSTGHSAELGASSHQRVLRIDPYEPSIRQPRVLAERLAALPWRGRFAVDGGLLVYRRAGSTYTYGKLEASVYIHALPNLSVGWTAGFASFHSERFDATVIIVPVRTHLRISPDYGTFRPFVDLAGVSHWLGPHGEAQWSFGGEIQGGIDIRPLTSKVFGCGVGVGGGYVGGATFDVQGGCSVQW
jgi:hypothetical protein